MCGWFRSRRPWKGTNTMKRNLSIFVILVALFALATTPAAAQNRYIVRTSGGLGSVLKLCLSANCQVQGSLDGNIGHTFLVTSSGTVVTHGYATQPAAQIIRLTDAQNGFNVTGSGIVAVIDTGVDINHP